MTEEFRDVAGGRVLLILDLRPGNEGPGLTRPGSEGDRRKEDRERVNETGSVWTKNYKDLRGRPGKTYSVRQGTHVLTNEGGVKCRRNTFAGRGLLSWDPTRGESGTEKETR